MERVAFLVEATGERISCLLNPESLLVRRTAGLAAQRSLGGQATGEGLTDDPLLATGGGSTEMLLDLLFDIYLTGAGTGSALGAVGGAAGAGAGTGAGTSPGPPPGSSPRIADVRDLTGPLWQLAETGRGEGYGRLPQVLFLWGKAWNVPGVVAAVSERLEHFTPGGVPTRSWLRLRLLRTGEARREPSPPAITESLPTGVIAVPDPAAVPEEQITSYAVLGGGLEATGEPGGSGERLDQIAARAYGDPRLWTVLAAFNGIVDPLHLPPGTVLRIPDASLLRGAP
jgi:hypothetical protein